ncbi:YgaP family membrane protein [Bacillus sp. FJAT-45350]|uniref:YgaP family membrane protein n=1 Tax=Bacillus sp. FJAT-45350 TaxID=2011014 RepID=UPI000BB707B9|nr:DUF2892 domain-containing protein [Bacillus sp. FJAT-45350]
MKPNISIINGLVRITCGFTLLTWATAKLVRRPYRTTPLIVAMLAGMKVGEGILRYCPLTDLFENKMQEMNQQQNQGTNLPVPQQAEFQGEQAEEITPVNPS